MTTATKSEVRAIGGKSVRGAIHHLGRDLVLTYRAKGHKSSEGDGRTAADIRRELAAAQQERD